MAGFKSCFCLWNPAGLRKRDAKIEIDESGARENWLEQLNHLLPLLCIGEFLELLVRWRLRRRGLGWSCEAAAEEKNDEAEASKGVQ